MHCVKDSPLLKMGTTLDLLFPIFKTLFKKVARPFGVMGDLFSSVSMVNIGDSGEDLPLIPLTRGFTASFLNVVSGVVRVKLISRTIKCSGTSKKFSRHQLSLSISRFSINSRIIFSQILKRNKNLDNEQINCET